MPKEVMQLSKNLKRSNFVLKAKEKDALEFS